MHITINGEKREIPDGLTVARLLSHLGIEPGRVAIERNLEILARSRWGQTCVEPNDRFEIVLMVGGG